MKQFALTCNEVEANAYGTKSAAPQQIVVKAHERKRQSSSVTNIVPNGTPTEVVEHRPSDEERIFAFCGAVMEKIGREVHPSLQMEPAWFWICEDIYYHYVCKPCEQKTGEANILKTPKEPVLPDLRCRFRRCGYRRWLGQRLRLVGRTHAGLPGGRHSLHCLLRQKTASDEKPVLICACFRFPVSVWVPSRSCSPSAVPYLLCIRCPGIFRTF